MSDFFNKPIKLLSEYKNDPNLTLSQKRNLDESIARLQIVSNQYNEIIKNNNKLLNEDSGLNSMREFMTEENISKILRKQAPKDPKLAEWLSSVGGKIAKRSSSEVSSYDMSNLDFSKPESKNISELHLLTESAYNNLWFIKERLNTLPKFRSFNPSKVRDVRNQLIVHIDKPNSGADIFSFGVATNGPVLRPVKPTNAKASPDLGFEGNIEEFLSKIERILEPAI